ncbi:MAG: hypothetical protein NTY86_19470 [Deltaproteobacteria bacterium]|nr:hypothetical protein [Deltaproteobacteria bacterium]
MDQGRLLVEEKPAEQVRRHVGRHVIEIVDPAEGLPAFLHERGVHHEDGNAGRCVPKTDGKGIERMNISPYMRLRMASSYTIPFVPQRSRFEMEICIKATMPLDIMKKLALLIK